MDQHRISDVVVDTGTVVGKSGKDKKVTNSEPYATSLSDSGICLHMGIRYGCARIRQQKRLNISASRLNAKSAKYAPTRYMTEKTICIFAGLIPKRKNTLLCKLD